MAKFVGYRHVWPTAQEMPGNGHHRKSHERLNDLDAHVSHQPSEKGAHNDGQDDDQQHGIGSGANGLPRVAEQRAPAFTPLFRGICVAQLTPGEALVEMSIYLVTGGAGFIGSHLAEELIRRGHHVRVADNFSTGKRHNIAHLRGAEVFEGDLADRAFAERAVQGMEYVLHQAAIPSVPRSIEDPWPSNRSNIDATLSVLLASSKASVKRVVYAASSSAYGNTPTLPKREEMPTNPRSPYALQKLVGESYCRMFTELYGLETVSTRYFNVFGPRQDPSSPYSGVISLFTSALLSGRRPVIYGDGEQTRDFTYIANVVHGVLLACEAPDVAGEMFNLAAGGRISLNQLLASLNGIIGTDIKAIYRPSRAGDVKDSQADISRATIKLGYRPIAPFEHGLAQTVDWCRTLQVPQQLSA